MALAANPNRAMRYFDDYQTHHHHPANKITHYFGIPMIVLAIAGLLSGVSLHQPFAWGLLDLDLGLAVGLAATAFYLWLDWRIGLPYSLIMLGFYIVGRQIMLSPYWWVLIVLFVVGWIFQYVGHLVYEKVSPAFYKNAEHLLVGPFWIFAKAVGYYKT